MVAAREQHAAKESETNSRYNADVVDAIAPREQARKRRVLGPGDRQRLRPELHLDRHDFVAGLLQQRPPRLGDYVCGGFRV